LEGLVVGEVRRMRLHEEGHYSAMEETTSATMNLSSDISGM
jgi:hypothetical protein